MLTKLYVKFKCQKGMGTVEVIIIIAILVMIALLFKTQITTFVKDLMAKYFDVPVIG